LISSLKEGEQKHWEKKGLVKEIHFLKLRYKMGHMTVLFIAKIKIKKFHEGGRKAMGPAPGIVEKPSDVAGEA